MRAMHSNLRPRRWRPATLNALRSCSIDGKRTGRCSRIRACRASRWMASSTCRWVAIRRRTSRSARTCASGWKSTMPRCSVSVRTMVIRTCCNALKYTPTSVSATICRSSRRSKMPSLTARIRCRRSTRTRSISSKRSSPTSERSGAVRSSSGWGVRRWHSICSASFPSAMANVRQAFDGLWTDWEIQRWRFIAYATQPVQNRDVSDFDDVSNRHLTFSGVRFERQGVGPGDLSGYYSRYNRDNAHFIDAAGDERRDVFDLRYTGKDGHVDWDVETMLQSGHVGNSTIGAWALGSLAGYTFSDVPGTPRAGIQIDAASGDRHPGDGDRKSTR